MKTGKSRNERAIARHCQACDRATQPGKRPLLKSQPTRFAGALKVSPPRCDPQRLACGEAACSEVSKRRARRHCVGATSATALKLLSEMIRRARDADAVVPAVLSGADHCALVLLSSAGHLLISSLPPLSRHST